MSAGIPITSTYAPPGVQYAAPGPAAPPAASWFADTAVAAGRGTPPPAGAAAAAGTGASATAVASPVSGDWTFGPDGRLAWARHGSLPADGRFATASTQPAGAGVVSAAPGNWGPPPPPAHPHGGAAAMAGLGAAFLGFDGVRAWSRGTSGGREMPALRRAVAAEAARIAAPRSAEQALAEANALMGKPVVDADIAHYSGAEDALSKARVTEVGERTWPTLEEARAAARDLQRATSSAVLRVGNHYVPMALGTALPDVVLYDSNMHASNLLDDSYVYSDRWTRFPSNWTKDSPMTSVRYVPYDRYVAREPGIVDATTGAGRQMTRLGSESQVALRGAERAVSQAPWRVPLELAGGAALAVAALLLWNAGHDPNR